MLRPGGLHLVAVSHRLFPTKAIRGWQVLPRFMLFELIRSYFKHAGDYETARFEDRSPPGADPLWIFSARRSAKTEK